MYGFQRNPVFKVKSISNLPDSYTNVLLAFFGVKNPNPLLVENQLLFLSLVLKPKFDWLQKDQITETINTDRLDISWSSHHASKKRNSIQSD